MKAVLGIDIGTSACKTALFDYNGKVLADASEGYPLYHPAQGYSEQNPGDFYSAVCRAVKSCIEKSGIDAHEIGGVGVDGQSWSCILTAEDGTVLAPDPIWMDTRSAAICDSLPDDVKELAFRTSGNPLTANYVTGKILWFRQNHPELIEKTYKVLQSEGYINYRLTGTFTMNYSEGYGFHCFDIAHNCWDLSVCEKLGIPARILPELHACDDIIGVVSEKAAAETGLAPGTPVVAGGLDAACAALGAGVVGDGQIQEQGGQSGGMSICTPKPVSDPRLILCTHVVPGKWLLQGGTVGGGSVVRWLENELGQFYREKAAGSGLSVPAMFDIEAASVRPGSDGLIFLPYMAGERTPIWDPEAKGVYYGIDFSKTRAHFLRAAMEGVAYSLLHNLKVAEEAGAGLSVLYATGGCANSRLWTQMKADMTGLPIAVCGSDNATGLGAAMLAGVATGFWPDYERAVACTVSEKRRHEPDPSLRATYARGFETYLELYRSLYPVMHR